MHNQSNNTKATNKQKKNFGFYLFIYDVMMTSSRHYSSPSPAEHGLVQEKKNIFLFRPKFWAFSDKKRLDFHPQTSNLQSNPKICTKIA